MDNKDNKQIRKFDSGATRDTEKGKLSYTKALSPIVLQEYVRYLGKHLVQSDGNLRDFDNWKRGIPSETYLDALGRHWINVWLLSQGYNASDNHGPVTLVDSLNAMLFNCMGLLHTMLTTGKVIFHAPRIGEVD